MNAMLYNPIGYVAIVYLIVTPIALILTRFQTFTIHRLIYFYIKKNKTIFFLFVIVLWIYIVYSHEYLILYSCN